MQSAPRMSEVSSFSFAVREIPHLSIPLPDGARLATRMWLPEGAGPVPAILEYLPYRKRTGTWQRDALTHPYLAGHGYACLRVDIRGSGESDGVLLDEYSQQELDDAVAVIAWIAAQEWCSGAVGMMGISWGGFNSLQVAALRPPALKAIITLCSTDDRYRDDVHFMGGALLTAKLAWAATLQIFMMQPPDPELVGETWRETWLRRMEATPLFLAQWLRHQRRDAYWRHGSVCEDYGAIHCPVLAIGGWTDGYSNAIPRLLSGLSVPRRGWIGPWAHGYPHVALPGPQAGFLQEALRWWDRWLKGVKNGVENEPLLSAWMMQSVPPAPWHVERPGFWIEEPTWPPPVRERQWFLSESGLSEAAGPPGPRVVDTPQSLGSRGGNWCPFGAAPDDAEDQHADDALSVCFDSAVLEADISILGAPILELELAANRPVAVLVARLCDVHPDESSLRVSFSVMNLTHRNGHATPEPLTADERVRVQLALNDVAFRFPAGHRIRVAFSTTYWPMVWPAPERASIKLLGGRLVLPEWSGRQGGAFPEAQTAPPAPRTVLQEGQSRREAGRDIASGESFYRSIEEPTLVRNDQLGIESGYESSTEYRIKDADPLSASVETRRAVSVRRGEWFVRTELNMRLSATRDNFRVQARACALNGGEVAFERDWDETIARDLL